MKILLMFFILQLHLGVTGIIRSNMLRKMFEKHIKDHPDINKECQLDISLFLKELQEGKLWALKMFDASAKIESGILEGNTMNLGSFDECIGIDESIESRNIMGQYCLVKILPTSPIFNNLSTLIPQGTRVSQAVCLPSTCSITDIAVFFYQFNVSVVPLKESCQTRNTFTFDTTSVVVLAFFSCVLALVLASTAYDFAAKYIFKKNGSTLLSAFSILTNGKKIFILTQNDSEITCVYGIRVLSIMWIIFLHLYDDLKRLALRNQRIVSENMFGHSYDFAFGGTRAVDTFLVLSGLMVSYVYLSTAKKDKFNIFKFYAHRYLRLTPALGAVILIYIGLAQFLNSGPTWLVTISTYQERCIKSWWKTIMYINNFDTEEKCLEVSWYLSVDMQLYVLSPIILLPLHKKPKLGISITTFFMISVMVTSFVITWIYNISSSPLYSNDRPLYMNKYYYPTYTRASPWFIGIIIGYIIHKTKQSTCKIKLKPFLVMLLWAISIAVFVCGLFEWESFDETLGIKLRNCFYNSFAKPLWAAAVGWVIFACYFKYGGFVNSFLSLPIFQILSRLCYTNFLIHRLILHIYRGRIRSSIHFSNADSSILFWGIYMYTQFASIILTLTFELPALVIDKLLLTKNQVKRDEQIREISWKNMEK